MRWSTISKVYAIVVVATAAVACGPAVNVDAPVRSAGDYDKPVPASEPRQELALLLELPAASDCEERFDLALYENRAIELVAWDEQAGGCVGREVTIRYLTSGLDQKAVLALAREHATSAEKKTQP